MQINPFFFAKKSPKVNLSSLNTIFSFGDSITAGQNASATSERYVNQYAAAKSLTLTNLAASGRGVWQACSAAQTANFTRSQTLMLVLSGLNDIRRSSSAKTIKKIATAYKAIVLKAITSTITASGASAVTRTAGVFSAYSAGSVGGLFTGTTLNASNTATYSGTNGATWEWSFTGTAFGIQFIANSGDVETFGTASIYIDNILTETINLNDGWYDNVSDGVYDNRRGPLAAMYHNLSNTTHTIKVVANGGYVPIDFFATIAAPASCAAMLFGEIPYLNSTGYAISPNQGSISNSNLASSKIKELALEYKALGFNIGYADTNSFYNLSTGVSSDNIHPNDTGMDQITSAMYDASYTIHEPFGVIYRNTNFTSTSDFVLSGSATASATGGKLIVGTTINGDYPHRIELNRPTGLGKYKIYCKFRVMNAPSSTTYGLGIGISSINTNGKFQNVGRFGMNNIPAGQVLLFDTGQPTFANSASNATAMSVAVNDQIELTLQQDVATITLTVVKNGATTLSCTFNYVPTGRYLPNVGRFAMYMFGGTYEVSEFKVESTEYKYARLMLVGDSKTQGYFANSFATTFAAQMQSAYVGIANNAGGFDGTQAVLDKIPEIIQFQPKKVLLNIGSNDKRTGMSLATWQANYTSIVNQLTAAGIDVYHLLQFNETALNFNDYNTFISTNYSAAKIVNAGVVGLYGDGVHPSQAGHDTIFNAIVSQIGNLL